MNMILFLMILVSLFPLSNAFAINEQIFITKAPTMKDVIFDGKWTNTLEWKQSSHNRYDFDDGFTVVHIRTAHLDDHIYVFINPINDNSLDTNLDYAIFCIDGKNEKNQDFDENDFCFSSYLGNSKGEVFQGNPTTSSLEKITIPEDFIAISSISDENDRYSSTPHPSYEFKIPIELFGRSDNYGFYFSVFDSNSNSLYTWPQSNSTGKLWSDIISPDKSLPELNIPILVMIIILSTSVIVLKKFPAMNYLNK